MNWPLFDCLPQVSPENPAFADLLLEGFLRYVDSKHLALYPAQEEAILDLYSGKNVILNTPTGSGKSLVAAALHFYSLANHRRSIYTCPIKALVNEKFLSLCKDFGPDQVGMITGDGSVNPDAPIICCTAEILANQALQLGSTLRYDDVIMDEFHYYSDRERGVSWQIPLLTLPQSRFLLMSATLGDTRPFEQYLTQLNQKPTQVIHGNQRPVPLHYEYVETPLIETISKLLNAGRAPVYVVNFTQRECAERAQDFLSIDFCTKDEKKKIQEAIGDFHFNSPYGRELQKILKHGIGIHHAGLLPKYRILVEGLAQKGLLKLIFGTDTLGVGVNVPIRTVVFTQLCKFDGQKTSILSVRDFQQISGRAGRRGFDAEGFVVIQAPEHIVENLRMEQKAAGDPKKLKKIVKRKPPEKGYVAWNKESFTRLSQGQPEALTSSFKVTHSMLLHVLSRDFENGGRAMQKLIHHCHDSPYQKRQHLKIAFQLFRSLVDRKIIELNPLRVHVDLQEDFSLHHALSLYLLDAIKILDSNSPDYALDVLTLAESILENPDLILRKQLDRIKSEKMEELRASGMDFDQRIEELEKLEYPKPNADFIYTTFNHFSDLHPWVGQENIRPKSIVREMYENVKTFPEYIRDYGLQRAEGVLLRYLSEAYKVLTQTVPEPSKTDALYEIIYYLESMIRGVDSSLIDEWEKLRNPNWVKSEISETPQPTYHLLRDKKKLHILIKNEVFKIIRSLSNESYDDLTDQLSGTLENESESLSIDRLKALLTEYFKDHLRICTDSKARAPQHTLIKESESNPGWMAVEQILTDPDQHNDWSIHLLVNANPLLEGQPCQIFIQALGPL